MRGGFGAGFTTELRAAVAVVALIDVRLVDVTGMLTVEGACRLVLEPPPHAPTASTINTAATIR